MTKRLNINRFALCLIAFAVILGTATLGVAAAPNLSLDDDEVTLGDSTGYTVDSGADVTSLDPDVATVDESTNTIETHSTGEATIRATLDGEADQVTLTVVEPEKSHIELNAPDHIEEDTWNELNVTLHYTNGHTDDITDDVSYTVENDSVATVNTRREQVLYGRTAGSTNITATYDDGRFFDQSTTYVRSYDSTDGDTETVDVDESNDYSNGQIQFIGDSLPDIFEGWFTSSDGDSETINIANKHENPRITFEGVSLDPINKVFNSTDSDDLVLDRDAVDPEIVFHGNTSSEDSGINVTVTYDGSNLREAGSLGTLHPFWYISTHAENMTFEVESSVSQDIDFTFRAEDGSGSTIDQRTSTKSVTGGQKETILFNNSWQIETRSQDNWNGDQVVVVVDPQQEGQTITRSILNENFQKSSVDDQNQSFEDRSFHGSYGFPDLEDPEVTIDGTTYSHTGTLADGEQATVSADPLAEGTYSWTAGSANGVDFEWNYTDEGQVTENPSLEVDGTTIASYEEPFHTEVTRDDSTVDGANNDWHVDMDIEVTNNDDSVVNVSADFGPMVDSTGDGDWDGQGSGERYDLGVVNPGNTQTFTVTETVDVSPSLGTREGLYVELHDNDAPSSEENDNFDSVTRRTEDTGGLFDGVVFHDTVGRLADGDSVTVPLDSPLAVGTHTVDVSVGGSEEVTWAYEADGMRTYDPELTVNGETIASHSGPLNDGESVTYSTEAFDTTTDVDVAVSGSEQLSWQYTADEDQYSSEATDEHYLTVGEPEPSHLELEAPTYMDNNDTARVQAYLVWTNGDRTEVTGDNTAFESSNETLLSISGISTLETYSENGQVNVTAEHWDADTGQVYTTEHTVHIGDGPRSIDDAQSFLQLIPWMEVFWLVGAGILGLILGRSKINHKMMGGSPWAEEMIGALVSLGTVTGGFFFDVVSGAATAVFWIVYFVYIYLTYQQNMIHDGSGWT